MKKLTAFLLFLSLILCSCAGKGEENGTESSSPTVGQEGIYADVPQENCKGYVFKILNSRTSSPASNMDAEEYTGDVIDDEVFARNLRVEEKLNVKIEQERDTAQNVFDKTVNSVLAGDGMYSAVFAPPSYMANLALDGYLLPVERMRGVDLEKPWWNESATEEVSVAGEKYMLFGDIQLSFYDAHSIVGFNMNIISDVGGIANPYYLAENGKWTLDRMFSMAKAVSADLDGNGTRNFDDRFGAASDGSEIIPLLEGAGKTMTALSENGVPAVTCHSDEGFYDAFMLISDAMYSHTSVPFVYDTVRFSADNLSSAAMFKGGNVLFFVTDIGHLYSLRDMEYEFGLLPMPKLDEKQKNYISYIGADSVTALGVPALLSDSGYTFATIENLAAESYRQGGTREKYLESVLKFRYVNDERSRKSLGVVLENGVFDRGEIYNFGGVADAVKKLCYDTDTYSSVMSKVSRMALTDIKDAVERASD